MWSTAVLVAALALLFLIYKKISKSRQYWKYINEIPGPEGKPVIGNLLEIMVPPEQYFLKRRKWGREFFPIYKTTNLHLAFVCIMTPEDVEKVINSKFHERKGIIYKLMEGWLRDGLLVSHGQKWKTRRRILTQAFHFTILEEFINIFNTETENLVEVFAKRCNEPYIDVVKPITEFTLSSIIETSMGVKLEKQKSAMYYKDALIELGELFLYRLGRPWLMVKPIYQLSQTFVKEKKCLDVIHNFSDTVIDERKKLSDMNGNSYSSKKRKAMLDLLLSAQMAGGDIDDAGIREEVDTFLFEGHDTTAIAICCMLMALANERDIQEDVVKEIHEVLGDAKYPTYSHLQKLHFMERCIKETLRLYPSIPLINRIAGEDIKTPTGYTIPKGTNIMLLIYELHRNPQIWEDPLKFDPDRFLPENAAKRHVFSYIPFSAGPRNCIGQKYGIFEIKAAMCGILRRFRLEPVDTPETVRYKTDIVLRPHGEIKVKFVPRR